MRRKHISKPAYQQKIAKERIEILFKEAKKMFREDHHLSNRYVQLARKIAMKYKVKIRSELKRKYCKHCLSYLVPGTNCRVRTQRGYVIYFCNNCKEVMRFVYKK